MAELSNDLIIASITTVGAVACAAIAAWGKKQKQAAKTAQRERDHVRREMDFKQETFDLSDFLKDWDRFYWSLQKMMTETNLDRFLILRAWNGIADHKFTTAVLQIRQGVQEPVSYVHVDLDDDYVQRLMRIKARGHIYFKVSDIDDCLIKRIYQAERVTHSLWVFLSQKSSGESNRLTYCSFATHDEHGFADEDITRMILLFKSLNGINLLGASS